MGSVPLTADVIEAVDLYYRSADDSPGQEEAVRQYEAATGKRWMDRPDCCRIESPEFGGSRLVTEARINAVLVMAADRLGVSGFGDHAPAVRDIVYRMLTKNPDTIDFYFARLLTVKLRRDGLVPVYCSDCRHFYSGKSGDVVVSLDCSHDGPSEHTRIKALKGYCCRFFEPRDGQA